MQIFIVAEGYDYEGTSRQWVYADPTAARNKYNQVVFKQRTGESACDWATIKGPYTEGATVENHDNKELDDTRRA